MRQTYEVMGTVASLDIPGGGQAVFDAVFARLKQIDEAYSPFKPTSQLSRYNGGELKAPGAEFKRIIATCKDWQKKTGGYFSGWYKDDFEPSGYVKGWAIAEGVKVAQKAGYKTVCLGIGGDVLAASDSDKIWGIGIQDPSDRTKILKTIEIKNGAVATSGNYERGAHIINPKTGEPANYWASVTICGPDIITADVLATACFAAGPDAQKIIKNHKQYEAIFIK